ncbi:MAG TPA: right-handed parallel beta-helix repeat-containing protein, partial [Anaerolineae bacterium]|nr:right-handed parallel beta-helix repeat-containing protein [Anaerolineae bacterium]
GTVNVLAGTYTELVTVNKTVTLRGAQQGVDARTRPFVAANESIVNNPGGSFSLQANNVVLDGFTVQGTTSGTGIYLSGAFSGYIIRNNIIRNNVFGLYPHSSGIIPTTIKFNLFQTNNVSGPANGNGIYSDQGLVNALIDSNLFVNHANSAILITHVSATNSNITISNNQMPSGSLGITLGGVTNSLVTRNTITNSTTIGIYLIGDNDNISVLRNVVINAATAGVRTNTFAPLGPNQNLHIDANSLTGNSVGIRIEANSLSGSIDANCNFIQGNSVGLRNDETDVVDANLNWWGNATGPTHASNPGGTGQGVLGSAVNLLPFASNTVACVGLTKTASAPAVVAGTRLTYTLAVSNAGATTASGVVLTDTLPADVTYATANPTPTGTNPLTWTVGTVTPGQNLTFTIVVTVNANATGNLTNTATLLRAAPSNAVTATITTTISSSSQKIYLPLIMKNAN